MKKKKRRRRRRKKVKLRRMFRLGQVDWSGGIEWSPIEARRDETRQVRTSEGRRFGEN